MDCDSDRRERDTKIQAEIIRKDKSKGSTGSVVGCLYIGSKSS